MEKDYRTGILLGLLSQKVCFIRHLLKYPDKFTENEIKQMLDMSPEYAEHFLWCAKEGPDDNVETAIWIIEKEENADLRAMVIRENNWLIGRILKKEYIDHYKKNYYDRFGVEIEIEEIKEEY